MAEEHQFQASRLCVNNCGFFGSTATENLCSKCYRDLQLKEQQASSAKQVLDQSVISPSSPSPTVISILSPSSPVPIGSASDEEEEKPLQQNRCMYCRRRVGLMGFKCKCGMMLCGTHRYPEKHECEFDFKELGREQIAKENPVLKGEKLEKI